VVIGEFSLAAKLRYGRPELDLHRALISALVVRVCKRAPGMHEATTAGSDVKAIPLDVPGESCGRRKEPRPPAHGSGIASGGDADHYSGISKEQTQTRISVKQVVVLARLDPVSGASRLLCACQGRLRFYQSAALVFERIGAGEGIRTPDPNLGKRGRKP
jgi:hypothetical protein